MKRFISILGFMLLFFTAKADTIGVYKVMHRGKVIATAIEFDTIRIKISKKEVGPADTLFIDYFSCGPRISMPQRVIVKDGGNDSIVLNRTMYHKQYFPLPLRPLLSYEQKHPGTVFDGFCILKESRHRIYFRLEFTP